ncbi:MAG: PAS domain S-box protein, partial [Candidatus Eremiobacteraeota bacterium]|nr:PAS domain S-box protein [Candidatus Eremiobacteraeota bacterium]
RGPAREPSVVALHVRSIACVPLRVSGEMLGAIYLDARMIPGLFQPGDRELLVAFAHQAALAIQNARLFDEERSRTQQIAALQSFQDRLLETVANGVITIDGRGNIASFNRSAEATLGVPTAELIGRPTAALAGAIDELQEHVATFFESGAVLLRAEVDARHRDGSPRILELRLSPLEFDGGVGVAIVLTDVTESRRQETEYAAQMARATAIQDSFSRYLAPHVLKSLVDDPSSVRLGGERRRSTMLFADIRGFTSLAATLSPERVVEILNTYFEEAVRILFEQDGLLDKFYGDGLMAVFGAPIARKDDAARAVAAAIRLQEAVRSDLSLRISYPLEISIGLATGDVVAGHFGSQRRMDYTVIGDAVNLAQGLQSAAPAGAIYLDEETYACARAVLPKDFHRIAARVKGRADLITAYGMFPENLPGLTP